MTFCWSYGPQHCWSLATGCGRASAAQAIPLAGAVYKALKQLLETVLGDSRDRFRRVVLIEYPRPGIWAIAFVTGTIGGEMQSAFPGQMLNVFVPTSPNPTTGWYAVVPESEVVNMTMTIEDAFKLIISGGIVSPNWSTIAPLPTSDSRLGSARPMGRVPTQRT